MSARSPENLRSETLCLYECGNAEIASVEERLGEIVRFIDEHREALTALQSQCKLEIVLGCSSGNGQLGFVISTDQIRQIALLPIDLVVDVYLDERPQPEGEKTKAQP